MNTKPAKNGTGNLDEMKRKKRSQQLRRRLFCHLPLAHRDYLAQHRQTVVNHVDFAAFSVILAHRNLSEDLK